MKARIKFDSNARDRPPVDVYVAPTVLEDGSLWSVVCRPQDVHDEGWGWTAQVEFLAPHAPHEVLISGFRFKLYEGPHAVAEVRVL